MGEYIDVKLRSVSSLALFFFDHWGKDLQILAVG